MPFYAMAAIPLIKELSFKVDTTQVWYADDSAAVGTITNIHTWWQSLISHRPAYGYFVTEAKTWLIMQKEVELEACNLFQGSRINIPTAGRPYLSALLGTDAFIQDFVCLKVKSWSSVIEPLTEAAASSPHTTYTTFTHGIMRLWLFLCRTIPNI